MITGIYKILNNINNKIYIGSAINIHKRWRDHKWYLKNNKHHNSHLQSSYNKYGIENFSFSIVLECEKENLLNNEKNFIYKFKSNDNKFGYNINDPRKIHYNKKRDNKLNKKHSIRMLGENNPMFGKKGQNHPKYGYNLSEDSKKNLSKKMKKFVGEKSSASKLNENDILNIRDIYKNKEKNQTSLAKLYGVTQVTISDIVNYKSWKHLK